MEVLEKAIRKALVGGRLPCAAAFSLAQRQAVDPLVVGEEANRLSIRISHCQLGLFGYQQTDKGRIVSPAEEVREDVEHALCAHLVHGRLPCKEAWEIALEQGLSKLEVANAAQALNVRISACQLGCFT